MGSTPTVGPGTMFFLPRVLTALGFPGAGPSPITLEEV